MSANFQLCGNMSDARDALKTSLSDGAKVPAHCRFSTFVFFTVFFYFLNSFSKMKAYNVLCYSSGIFFSHGLLANQSRKLSEWWVNNWSKVKTLEDKPKSGWPVFFTNCVRNVSEKAICVIIPQDRKVKNFSFTISKFWAQRYGAIWPTKVGKPWTAKTVVHTSYKYDVRRICKLYTERTTGR